jgi:rRNA maturation protein Rpf1
VQDLHTVIPHSHRVSRGKMSLEDLAETASEFGVKYVMLVARWRGSPGKLEFYRPNRGNLKLLPPIIYIKGVRFQREYEVAWRKLRIRPKKLFTLKGCGGDAVKIAEALSKFFNSRGWVESVEGAERDTVCLKVGEAKPHHIAFYSMVGGRAVEIGPSLTVRHVVWRVEKPEEG